MTDKATDKRPGFFMIENAVILDYNLAPHSLALYNVIVLHVNHKTGAAFPSIATLANEAHMSRQSVITHLKKLEEAGLILRKQSKKDNGSNAVNHYYLLPASEGGVVKEVDQGSQGDGLGVAKEVDSNKTKDNKIKDIARVRARDDFDKIDPDSLTDFQATVLARCLVNGYWQFLPKVMSNTEQEIQPLIAGGILERKRKNSDRLVLTDFGQEYMAAFEDAFADVVTEIQAIAAKVAENQEKRARLNRKKKSRKAKAPPEIHNPEYRKIFDFLKDIFAREQNPQSDEDVGAMSAYLFDKGLKWLNVYALYWYIDKKADYEDWGSPFSVWALRKYHDEWWASNAIKKIHLQDASEGDD